MTLLSLTRVERSYGDLVVFSGVSFRIGARDRIGVVGDNGTGKTTLARVITGQDPPEGGERRARRDLAVAWTTQVPDLGEAATVRAAAAAAFARLDAMEAELRRLEEAMAEDPDDPHLVRRHDEVRVVFESAGGYRRGQLAERALAGLGFAAGDLDKPVRVLSGGEKARVALARAMLVPADLLVLDEPTNHLDLEGTLFLEDWLCNRAAACVVVSHDRRFLDRVCTSILEVDAGKVTRYRGDYSAYRAQKERELDTALREFRKQEDFVAKETAYIRKHMGGRWTAQARGRLKRLARLERLAKPKRPQRRIGLAFGKAKGLRGQCVLEGRGLAVSFGGETLFHDVDIRVFHGDRAGLVGRNGTGKTTLLEILAGLRAPGAGSVDRAKKLEIAYFGQEMDDLPRQGTLLSTSMQLVGQWTEGECRDHLARFGFRGDDVDAAVDTLSGGEQRRLCLARLVVSEADIYLMDEPTNHLDITTREALEDALRDFPGTALLVSHDRYFLAAVASRVFELRPDGLEVHEGGVRAWEEKLAERRRATQGKAAEHGPRRPAAPHSAPRSPGKIRNPYAFEKLEQRIFALEEELGALHGKLTGADSWKRPEQLKSMRQRENEVRTELAALYEQWENWQ